jgi:hypothetical protein
MDMVRLAERLCLPGPNERRAMLTVREVIDLMHMAERYIQAGEIECAAWRVADAGGLLREALEALPHEADLIGLDCPTGRGYVLPKPDPDTH